jgi:hypothetical protein
VESLPGVEALAITYSLPLEPQVLYTPVIVAGRPLTKDRYHGCGRPATRLGALLRSFSKFRCAKEECLRSGMTAERLGL